MCPRINLVDPASNQIIFIIVWKTSGCLPEITVNKLARPVGQCQADCFNQLLYFCLDNIKILYDLRNGKLKNSAQPIPKRRYNKKMVVTASAGGDQDPPQGSGSGAANSTSTQGTRDATGPNG